MKRTNPFRRAVLVAAAFALALAPVTQAGFDEGMSHLKAGKYLEAAAEFQTAVDDNPTWADGYQLLGICFLKTSKPRQAEENFLKAIELNGDNFAYYFNLANAYQMQERWEKVVSTVNKAEKLATANQKEKLYKPRGFALAQQRKWADAIDDLEKARRVEADPMTLTLLGKAYFTVGENEKSVSTLREAAKLDTKNAETHRLMAEALLQLGGTATSDSQKTKYYRDALSEAEATLRLDSRSTNTRYLVGRAALGAGDYQKAVDSLQQVLEQKPNHCNAMANQGKAFMAMENWANAVAALDNATRCDSKMSVAWENKGFALQKQKKYDEAVQSYGTALRIKPDSSIARKGIETCQENMEVIAHNTNAAKMEQEQEDEVAAAKRKYEEELARVKQWEEKKDD